MNNVLLAFVLFVLLNFSPTTADTLRSFAASSLAPAWRGASSIKRYLADRPLGFTRATPRETPPGSAHVIYRDPSSWSSSLWIDRGSEDDPHIEKNSPVVEGNSLIGVIDYVGKRRSRVRLITDSTLAPAVRVARGHAQDQYLALELQTVSELLAHRPDLATAELQRTLADLSQHLQREGTTLYLAKGELHGSSAPLFRSTRPLLHGIGFNFQFLDEGETRPEGIPILCEGDLLVTSGLDGLFPPGLWVATVLSMKDQGITYELTARPTASDLNGLEVVQVLPAIQKECDFFKR